MREFRDKAGTAWQLDLNVGECLRVKAASDGRYNLLDPESQPGGESGSRPLRSVVNTDETNDFAALWELLFLIVEPLAADRQISANQFALLMPPACLVLAQDALIKEWADFFQNLRRPEKAAALERMAIYQAKAVAKVKAKLASQNMADIDASIERKMDALLNDSFGDLEASLALTPAPSPGDSST